MKLLGNTLLIKLDPENSLMSNGLFRPDNAHEHVLRTGEVVQMGPGKYMGDTSNRFNFDGLKVGDGVVFIKFLATHTETAKGLASYIPEGHAILKPEDVMLTYDRSEPVEFKQ